MPDQGGLRARDGWEATGFWANFCFLLINKRDAIIVRLIFSKETIFVKIVIFFFEQVAANIME